MNIIISYSHFFNLTCAYPGKARAAPGLAMRSNNDNDNDNDDNDNNDNKNIIPGIYINKNNIIKVNQDLSESDN